MKAPERIEARHLLREIALRGGIGSETLERIFEGTPVDFPVRFSSRLPLMAHRLGMIGITLFGTVHLLARTLDYPPGELLVLLRHEAEHVRQQRTRGLVFYPRYLYYWIRHFFGSLPHSPTGRWRRAYFDIPDEREAYAAGDRARRLLNRK